MSGFEISGMDAFSRDWEELITRMPDEVEKMMRKEGRRFTKDVNTKLPSEYESGKTKIPKKWKLTPVRSAGVATSIEIRNTSPVWHLVENGHRIRNRKGGPELGFVPGKKAGEKTRMEWDEKFPDDVKKWFDEQAEKSRL